MEGRVRFSDQPAQLFEFHGTRQLGFQWNETPLPQPPSAATNQQQQPAEVQRKSIFRFYGYHLDRTHLQQMIRRWVRFTHQPPKAIDQLTARERYQLLTSLSESEPLPEHWFFNGYAHVHVDGRSQVERPDADRLLSRHWHRMQELVEQERKEAEKWVE